MMLALAVAFNACQQQEEVAPSAQENPDIRTEEQMAQEVVALLQNPKNRLAILSTIEGKPQGVKVSEVLSRLGGAKAEKLSKTAAEATHTTGSKIRIPEMWLHGPADNANAGELLVAFPPAGDEKQWTKVKAYNLKGEVVYLDAKEAPAQPVIVVETYGFQAFEREVELMNRELQRAGLQRAKPARYSTRAAEARAAGVETTRLDQIRLKDDQEPWVSGAAEVYAVTSGIRNASNEAEVAVIPMYYLDHKDETYYPGQIMLFWDDYAYQAANIQYFEKDSGYNYQELVSIIVSGIADIAGTLTGQFWVTALGNIASAIIEVLPSSFWTNDDDYIDSFYTVQKGVTYTNRQGAAKNATVTLSPLFIAAN